MKIKGKDYTFQDFKNLVEQKPEFCMKTETINGKKFFSFFYNVAFEDTFNTDLSREFRGIVFNEAGECVARPFHKFFNIGEREETQIHNIDADTFFYNDKFDGSLVYGVVIDGEVHLRTKKSFTSEVAILAQKNITHQVRNIILEDQRWNRTTLFEFISPENRIVVKYPETCFKELQKRNNETGEYIQGGYVLPSSKLKDFIERTKKAEDIEGYVIQGIKNDSFVDFWKIKTDWYFQRHRAKDNTIFKNVFEAVKNQTFDDILGFFKENDMQAEHDVFLEKVKIIQKDYREFHQKVEASFPAGEFTQKEFAEHIRGHELEPFMYLLRSGKSVHVLIFKRLLEKYKGTELWLK